MYQTYLLEDSRFMSPGTGIDYSKPIARVQVMPDTWHNLSRDYDGEELYPMTDDQVEEAYQLNLQRIKNLKLFAQDNQPFIGILHDAGFLVEELSENLHKHLAIPQYMFILFNYWGLDNELFERLKRAFSGYYTGSLDDSLANDKDFLDVSREHRLKHNKEQRDKAEAARVIKINKMIKIGSVIGFLIIASIYYFI